MLQSHLLQITQRFSLSTQRLNYQAQQSNRRKAQKEAQTLTRVHTRQYNEDVHIEAMKLALRLT